MLGVARVIYRQKHGSEHRAMERTALIRCAGLMARQRGLISRPQALALGLSSRSIEGRIDRGEWVTLRRGIYAEAGAPPGSLQRLMAICLAGGPDTYVTSKSAAWLWDLAKEPSRHFLITTRPRARSTPQASMRRTTSLGIVDTTTRYGIPVTTVDRTIIECARDLDEASLRQIIEKALRVRLTYPGRVEKRLAELVSQGRRGSGSLRKILAEINDGQPPTESELESAFLQLCRRAKLKPTRQVNVHDETFIGRVDFCFRDEMVIVEVDGRDSHTTRFDFENDRARDARLTAAGWTVLRFTWRQVKKQPDEVIAALHRTLGHARDRRWNLAT